MEPVKQHINQWPSIMADIKQKAINSLLKLSTAEITILHITVKSAPQRYVYIQAYYEDIKDGLIVPLEHLPVEEKNIIWNMAKLECGDTVLNKRHLIDLCKCMYWFDCIIQPYVKE